MHKQLEVYLRSANAQVPSCQLQNPRQLLKYLLKVVTIITKITIEVCETCGFSLRLYPSRSVISGDC